MKNEYLPGDILSVFLGKSRSLVKEEEIFKSKIGNWMAIKLYHKGRTLVVINIYQIPSTSSNGNKCSLMQYNLAEGKAKSTNDYRKEILLQIKEYLKKQ